MAELPVREGSVLARTVLRVTGVGRRYAGIPALTGVTMDVRAGEVLAVVGENGAGKSTLLKILSGVIAPSDGVIEQVDANGTSVKLRAQASRSSIKNSISRKTSMSRDRSFSEESLRVSDSSNAQR